MKYIQCRLAANINPNYKHLIIRIHCKSMLLHGAKKYLARLVKWTSWKSDEFKSLNYYGLFWEFVEHMCRFRHLCGWYIFLPLQVSYQRKSKNVFLHGFQIAKSMPDFCCVCVWGGMKGGCEFQSKLVIYDQMNLVSSNIHMAKFFCWLLRSDLSKPMCGVSNVKPNTISNRFVWNYRVSIRIDAMWLEI